MSRRETLGPAAGVRVPLSALFGTPRHAQLSDDARGVLRSVRLDVDQAAMCGPFDIRQAVHMGADALDDWRRRRAAWAADLLADDPRVVHTTQDWRDHMNSPDSTPIAGLRRSTVNMLDAIDQENG